MELLRARRGEVAAFTELVARNQALDRLRRSRLWGVALPLRRAALK